MNAEARKKVMKVLFQKIVDPMGYKFSPDKKIVDMILEQEIKLEEKYGYPYCPCKVVTKSEEENMKIVCPCIEFNREHYDFMKRCWCGLFVHKDVDDPSKLKLVTYNEFKKQAG